MPLKTHIFLTGLEAGIDFPHSAVGWSYISYSAEQPHVYHPTVADKFELSTFLTVQYSQLYLFTVADQSDFFNSAGSCSASF